MLFASCDDVPGGNETSKVERKKSAGKDAGSTPPLPGGAPSRLFFELAFDVTMKSARRAGGRTTLYGSRRGLGYLYP